MNKIRVLLIVVVLLNVLSTTWAGDSLEAKLAKFESAAKAKQSDPESSTETQTTEATALQDPIKSLTERIDELESRQNSMREANTGRYERIASLEKKLAALPEQLNREPDEALVTRLDELEHKIQLLESQSHTRQADTEPDPVVEEKVSESQPVAPAPQVRTHAVPAAPPVIKMTGATTTMAGTSHADSHGGEHTIHSEPSGLGVTASATYAGKYIWYGFDEYDDDSAFHPKMEVDLWGSGFVVELAYWASVNSGHVKYDEVEYGLAYHGHTGQGKGTVHYCQWAR